MLSKESGFQNLKFNRRYEGINERELPVGALAANFEDNFYIEHYHFIVTMPSTCHNDSETSE